MFHFSKHGGIMSKKYFFIGTFILSGAGFLSRLIGFFYRIFLSHTLGASGVGIFQLTVPLQTLLLALCAGGTQTAISHFCASANAQKDTTNAKDYFFAGTLFSLVISVLFSCLLYTNAAFAAQVLLQEPRTKELVALLALSLPFSVFHTCINSYYFARKETLFPSILQLLEQAVRVLSSYGIYFYLSSKGLTFTPGCVGLSTFFSEIVVSCVSFIAMKIYFSQNSLSLFPVTKFTKKLQKLLYFACPLTLNRILLTLLGSIEVTLIPKYLLHSGMTDTQALSVYGILSGMTLPLILFPSTFTNSAAVMLMPSVTELRTLKDQKRIRYVIKNTYQSILLMGTFFTILFFFFGNFIGNLLFHNPTVGIYLKTLSFVCPFLYLNTALSSILNGLDKQGKCLLFNVLSICTRIFFVVIIIPKLGINGYLYGIILSEFVKTFFYSCLLLKNHYLLFDIDNH